MIYYTPTAAVAEILLRTAGKNLSGVTGESRENRELSRNRVLKNASRIPAGYICARYTKGKNNDGLQTSPSGRSIFVP